MNFDQVVDRLRAGQTQRYHTNVAEMLKTQDVAQHVYGVMWLVTAIMRDQPSVQLLLATLAHDAGERWTGDVPSPAKRRIPGVKEAFDAAEADEVVKHCGFTVPPLAPTESAVLDLADALDGAFLCAREAALGNRLIGKTFANFIEYSRRAAAKLFKLAATGRIDGALVSHVLYHLDQAYAKHDFRE